MQIELNSYGRYLGTKGQNFVLYENKKPVSDVPFYKVSQIVLGSGNCVSTSALFWASVFGIDVMVVSKTEIVPDLSIEIAISIPCTTIKRNILI